MKRRTILTTPSAQPNAISLRGPFRVGVAGCGIAGTTAAYLLARAGHAVTICERAPECGPVGAGILLQPAGQRILARLGLLARLEADAERIDAVHAVRYGRGQLVRLRYGDLAPDCHALGVTRGSLFELLHGECRAAGVDIRLGCTISERRVTDQGVWLVDAAGGEHGPFDFVLGADGSRSALRAASGLAHRQHDYRYAALWGVGPCSDIRHKLYQVVRGTGTLIGLLPTGHGRCSFFYGLRADRHADLRARGFDAFRREVVKLCPPSEQVFDEIRDFDQLTFGSYRHVTLPAWHDERTLLLGDAAHAMSPHLGQGANLALLDAAEFARCLAEREEFAAACRAYTERRRAAIRFYARLTHLLTPFFQSDGRIRGWGRDLFLPWMPRIPWLRRQMLLTVTGQKTGWLSEDEA